MFTLLNIPPRAHPLVRRLYEEMNRQQVGLQQMANRSGYSVDCLKDWRTRASPNICSLEACFNVLGYELTVKRRGE